jgi:hypothetical protein
MTVSVENLQKWLDAKEQFAMKSAILAQFGYVTMHFFRVFALYNWYELLRLDAILTQSQVLYEEETHRSRAAAGGD